MTRILLSVAAIGLAIGSIVSCSDKSATAPDGIVATNGSTDAYRSVASVSVSLQPTSIVAGDSARATAVVRDNRGRIITGTVTWSTGASSVATVSAAGIVRGRAAGTTSITAARGSKTGSATLTVTTPAAVAPVATVTVSLQSSTINPGQTTQGTAIVRDSNNNVLTGRAIVWQSSNTTVATESTSGLSSAIASGTSQITATSEGKAGGALLTVVVPAPPPPPPPPPTGVLATSDFSDGTIRPFINNQPPIPGGEIDVVADPTASGHGNVARLHYHHFTSADRNVALGFDHAILPGQTVYFRGDFYLATSNLSDFGRKLLYWQQHTNYTKYGSNTDGGANFSSVVGMEGTDLLIDNYHVDHTGRGIHDQHYISRTMVPNRWYRLEMQTTAESPVGAGNGICRIWLDGVLIYESTTTNWVDAAMIGQPLPGGNGTPLAATDIYFEHLLVGQQVNDNTNSAYDEYRYWDNVVFSTSRAP